MREASRTDTFQLCRVLRAGFARARERMTRSKATNANLAAAQTSCFRPIVRLADCVRYPGGMTEKSAFTLRDRPARPVKRLRLIRLQAVPKLRSNVSSLFRVQTQRILLI